MSQSSNDLDTTISALQGGLTSINPTTAVSVIDKWHGVLSGAGLTDIAGDLAKLKGLLTGGNLDGKAIGALLTKLGQSTTEAAQSATGDTNTKVAQLGSLLTRAGGTLS